MKSLIRRLDDALCAFVFGHSRRDLKRVRRRRLILLGERLAKRERYCAAGIDWPYLRAMYEASADRAQRALDRLVKVEDRVAIGRDIKRGIRELRGIALARRCRTISINRLCDRDKLDGVTGPVVIDGSLHRHTGRHKDILIATVQGLVAAINAMRP